MATPLDKQRLLALHVALNAIPLAVVGTRFNDPDVGPASGVSVDPSSLQASAQATIDAWDWSQSAQDLYTIIQTGKKVGQITPVRLAANRTNSTNVLADVTGMSFQLAPNSHYVYQFVGAYSTVGATTGLQLAVNGPASPVLVRVVGRIATSVTAQFNDVASVYDGLIAATASAGATALPFYLDGNVSTGATGGLFTLRFRSEINGNLVTIFSGSYGLLYGVA